MEVIFAICGIVLTYWPLLLACRKHRYGVAGVQLVLLLMSNALAGLAILALVVEMSVSREAATAIAGIGAALWLACFTWSVNLKSAKHRRHEVFLKRMRRTKPRIILESRHVR